LRYVIPPSAVKDDPVADENLIADRVCDLVVRSVYATGQTRQPRRRPADLQVEADATSVRTRPQRCASSDQMTTPKSAR
jgi:hypothetical protein